LVIPAGAQSNKLKQKERELKKKIENTKHLIKLTRNTEQLTLAELGILSHQIAYREELVANINYQMRKLDNQVEDQQKQILTLENNLKELKEEYAKMIRYAYKNRNVEYQLIYIFSAKSYTEAYHRMKYIKHYAEYRKRQVVRIKETQALHLQLVEELKVKKGEKTDLALEQKSEKQNFIADKELKQQAWAKLKADEQNLQLTLNAQVKKRKQISKAIREAIEKEIALAKKNSSSKTGFNSTPESKQLSKNFAANKGRLPWPVAKGEITGKYGKHRHADVNTAEIDNKGVDITTTAGAEVRAVFNGKVSSVLIIPGAGKVVMIQHGAYKTIYTNLKDVFVKKGESIKTKQKIGSLLTEGNSKTSEAHLEIWKITSSNMGTENPSLWIYR
jgi:septal ring factor EnvC (AmiA/AmiB activator)